LGFVALARVTPVQAQPITPAPNPDLTTTCGLDVILVLDESGSLLTYQQTVRDSVRGLLEALSGTGSRVALVEFNLDARTPLGPAYIDLTNEANGPLSPTGQLSLYLDNNYVPNGYTNWDAALGKVAEINSSQGRAPLVIFFTDSDPNVYTNQFGSIVGGDDGRALEEAIEAANGVKAQGSHLFVVGVGDVTTESRLVAISGPERFPDANAPFTASDYTLTDYAQLTTALRQIAFSLCGPSVTVTKYADSGNGLQPVAGQGFSGAVNISSAGQPANGFVWTQPVSGVAPQVGTSQNATTGATGTAQWQWTPGTLASPQPWNSQFVLDEVSLPGYFFASASCTRKTLNPAGGFTASGFSLSALPATFAVGPNDLITCDVVNERLSLVVQKTANPTAVPEAGGDVTFGFTITNNGTAAATLTALTDSVFGNLHGQGTCVANGSTQLAVGASYQCNVIKRLAGNRGSPHSNTVTATLRAANGTTVSNTASATVTFYDSLPTATLTRSVNPSQLPEPGGAFTYAVQITNNSAGEGLQLTALSSTPFGNVTTIGGAVTATTCAVPQTLARAGQTAATYNCQFTATVNGAPGVYTDTLIAVTSDDDGNVHPITRDQSVTIVNRLPAATLTFAADPQSLPEPGGTVNLTATITNNSAFEALTLSALSSTLPELTSAGNLTTSCQVPQTLAAGATYRCTYQALIQQNSGTYPIQLNATVADDDNSTLALNATTALELTNLPSSLLVTNRANQTTIAEPGGDITFQVTVKNTSAVDTVQLTAVVDDRYGNLATACSPALPATVAPAATVTCLFVGTVSGAVGSVHTNAVTATATDDDGYIISDSDEESIEITDLPALLEITQIAEPANLPEPGGPVTVTTLIKNISPVDAVTIGKVETNEVDLIAFPTATAGAAALIDISTTCLPTLPATLAPGAELECRFTKQVTGPIRRRHTSTVVVSGIDDENLPLQQSSREAIDIINVPSSIRVTESSNPVSVPEAGAPVTFTVRIRNTSAVDTVTLQTLTNSRFGDLHARCPGLLPALLAPSASRSCTFTEFVSGDVDELLQQQISAAGLDDDGEAVADSTESTIGVTDTPSALKITQVAEPSGVAEPGGLVTFTLTIRNSSPVDAVTINSVADSRSGAIGSGCQPSVPTTLAPGTELSCRFSDFIGGNAATVNQRLITVTGIDDDAVAVSDFDLITIDVLDLVPMGSLVAAATPNQILETGARISMTVTIVNEGPEITTLTALSSTLAGDLHGLGDCVLPQSLPANGGSYRCTFTHFVDGVATAPPLNVVTAVVYDDEGNQRLLTDNADLFLLAVVPVLQLIKDDTLLVDLFDNPADEGKVSPDDTVQYMIQIRNTGNGPAQQVLLQDTPDLNSRLIVGSVTTSKGAVLLGNTTGNTEVLVLLGDLAVGETVTVEFAVLVSPGTGTTLLRNQAFLSYGSFSDPSGTNMEGSDDPTTPFLGDPTDTRVFIPPTGLDPEEEPAPLSNHLYLPMIQQ
jgi:uncharacterized repeat protein (TIGR01451 family)